MADTLDPHSVDKRTWERYALSGKLDAKAYAQALQALPDVADKATVITSVMFEDEQDDVEESNAAAVDAELSDAQAYLGSDNQG